ncbi:MAG: hypothetical protein FWD05_10610 [Oscillospiraceae bacterium]|nr:hypothetical protein [Oscillospiraceae bacterium]
MNITPEERSRAINDILDKGLVVPVSTPIFLRNMVKELGFGVMFRGALPGIFLSFLIVTLYVLLTTLYVATIPSHWSPYLLWNHYALLFLFSPILFIGLTISTEAAERMRGSGLYELKMTFRYTTRQITAFKLLCFSFSGAIFAVIGGDVLNSISATGNILQSVSLSLSAVFLCTLLIVHTMRRFRAGWWVGATIWITLALLPMIINMQWWEEFLAHLPPALILGVALVAFILFLREIKIITREVHYADC